MENSAQTGVVTNLQRFSMHDGPGVRTTVFLKGCPLRCRWCHNPETQRFAPQVEYQNVKCMGCGACAVVCPRGCHRLEERHSFDSAGCAVCFACVEACPVGALTVSGRRMSAGEVLDTVERDRAFYLGRGGMTLSGGEPMAQPAFALALLAEADRRGVGTAIETCGAFPGQYAPELAALCDHIYYDLKDSDPVRHLRNTGGDLTAILENLSSLAVLAAQKITVRCILLAGVNDNESHVDWVCAFARQHGIHRVELLAFHPMGSGKYAALGETPPADMTAERIPAAGTLEALRARVREQMEPAVGV